MGCLCCQAAFDLITADERSQLLQNLASALIKNATAADEIEAVIFVTVDLINRRKNEEVTDSKIRVLYATLNQKAGQKALSVPDFHSAVKYTESALSFLNESHWLSHHDLMLSIYQTSVAALYSNANSDGDLLRGRINLVFRHARNLNEEFRTRLVWVRFICLTSLCDAIEECHVLLERLGEPIESSNMTADYARSELVRIREALLNQSEKLSGNMTDPKILKAMKVLMYLFGLYYKQKSFAMLIIVCTRMVELSMKYGCSEESIYALASFASNLVGHLGDIDIGCSWARMSLAMLTKNDCDAVLPEVVSRVKD